MWNVLCSAGKSPVQAKYFFCNCAAFRKGEEGREFQSEREGGRPERFWSSQPGSSGLLICLYHKHFRYNDAQDFYGPPPSMRLQDKGMKGRRLKTATRCFFFTET